MSGRGAIGLLVASLLPVAAACGDSAPSLTIPSDSATVGTPVLIAGLPIPPQYGVHDTFIREGIAFVAAWNTGLILYDVGNGMRGGTPASPVEISRIVTSDSGVPGGPAVHNAWWFHNPVTGERRYVFVGQEGPATIPSESRGDIHVVDVADLLHPREVAFYHLASTPSAGAHNFWMDEARQILYAAYYNGGVVALDVSGTLAGDLSSRVLARLQPSATPWVWSVQISGTSLYASDILHGLYQLRLSGGSFTLIAGGDNVPDRYTSDLWVNGEYAYTGTWGAQGRNGVPGNALKVWHLSTTGAPTLVDSIVTDSIGTVSDVKGSADGRLLVFSAEVGPRAGLYVATLADPARPRLIGRVIVPEGLHTAKVADIGGRRYVFAARNPGSARPPALLIYDVTDLELVARLGRP